MEIWLSEEDNPQVIAALQEGSPVYIHGELSVDDSSSANPQYILTIRKHLGSSVLDVNAPEIDTRYSPFDISDLSPTDLAIIMDRLEFKRGRQVYTAIIRAFFPGVDLSAITAFKTLTLGDIFYGFYMPEFGAGSQQLKTGLEKMVDHSLLFSEPKSERRPGKARHYTPNPASLNVWGKLIEKYVA